ncbi:MAG: hypothetical protein ABIQ95_11785 [Bdellovibrionia bacterium]
MSILNIMGINLLLLTGLCSNALADSLGWLSVGADGWTTPCISDEIAAMNGFRHGANGNSRGAAQKRACILAGYPDKSNTYSDCGGWKFKTKCQPKKPIKDDLTKLDPNKPNWSICVSSVEARAVGFLSADDANNQACIKHGLRMSKISKDCGGYQFQHQCQAVPSH